MRIFPINYRLNQIYYNKQNVNYSKKINNLSFCANEVMKLDDATRRLYNILLSCTCEELREIIEKNSDNVRKLIKVTDEFDNTLIHILDADKTGMLAKYFPDEVKETILAKNKKGNTTIHSADAQKLMALKRISPAKIRTAATIKNEDGDTPIHLADKEATEFFIKIAQDRVKVAVGILNNQGLSPIDCAGDEKRILLES